MQEGKKIKGWAKETSDIRIVGEGMKKELERMDGVIKTLQIEIGRILKELDMKSYAEEMRERMFKADQK
ncbi:MAG: hypothetical protein ACXADU_19455 [Promethearchaeota archaeon]|jgi:acylphosphatase